MSTIYPLLKILSIIIVVLVGILSFNEHLKTNHIIGILLGVVAIYLLSL